MIPAEMKTTPRWVVWKSITNQKSGKVDKVPHDPRTLKRFKRDSGWQTTPALWVTYDEAAATGWQTGFLLGDGWAGLDIDDVVLPDGAIAQWAQNVVRQFDSYVEVSPSGTGLKIFMRGTLDLADGEKPLAKRAGIEVYDRKRFFTVTGRSLPPGLGIGDCTETLRDLYGLLRDGDVLELLRLRGLLLRTGKSDYVDVICPWANEHTSSGNHTSTSLHVTDNVADGFKCLHAHCEHRTIADVKKWLGLPKHQVTGDEIIIRGGALTKILDEVETRLVGRPIYQRGGVLVRPVTLDQSTVEDTVRRSRGSIVLARVNEHWLTEEMAAVAQWGTLSKDGGFRPIDPPAKYARHLVNRGAWSLPPLRGLIHAPTLDVDGRVIQTPGFDTSSGLLLTQDGCPPITEQPTQAEALASLAVLRHPFRKMPWASPEAESVALSAILTALIRSSLRSAPAHTFDAPTPGTGKSLVAEAAGLIAIGVKPSAMNQASNEEENEKRVSTMLMAGDPVIHIDNCDHPLGGAFFCSLLTQETVQARILGQSERRVLPTNVLVTFNGNNLSYFGDITRRIVTCRLDARLEHPEEREFDFDVHEEIRRSRWDLVRAGLTILRAYHLAGRPEVLPPFGGFADYDWVRGALVWVGMADPVASNAGLAKTDSKKEDLVRIMDLWEAALKSERVTVAEIQERSEITFAQTTPPLALLKLRQALLEVTKPVWNSKSVGKWFGKHKDRMVGTRVFRKVSLSHGSDRWYLEA